MAVRAVIFDLDDTLIVEKAVARASLRSTSRLVAGVDPERVEEAVLAAARAAWRAGPCYGRAAELDIASWEGLWALTIRSIGPLDAALEALTLSDGGDRPY